MAKTPKAKPVAVAKAKVKAGKGPRRDTANASAPAPASRSATATVRVRIRMYRLGVGDCFLVSFPRDKQEDFRILIDCGVHQAQTGGSERIAKVVEDLHAVTGGKIDVVVGTHEHQDHLSGFPTLLAKFKAHCAGEVWAAWTEDGDDSLAKSLRGKKDMALVALSDARARMALAGASEEEMKLTSLLGFFGDGSGPRLKEFGGALRQLSATIKYRTPGEEPIELEGLQARVFVLGPPRDATLLGQSAPSKTDETQVYKFGAYATYGDQIAAPGGDQPAGPFDDRFSLPLQETRGIPFFDRHYWSDTDGEAPGERVDKSQGWRRIDADWMNSATTLAIKLDEDTNNTSLVLAFELGPKDKDGPVLLFAADAQVGNWLSWQKLKWTYHDRTITASDLLSRTIVYKVGHHASHNATLNKLGLELMSSLDLALVPTDSEMAEKVKWGTLPWGPLLERLEAKARSGVVRTDQAFGNKKFVAATVKEDPLYYEVEI